MTAADQFATLVVQLPVAGGHGGGALVITSPDGATQFARGAGGFEAAGRAAAEAEAAAAADPSAANRAAWARWMRGDDEFGTEQRPYDEEETAPPGCGPRCDWDAFRSFRARAQRPIDASQPLPWVAFLTDTTHELQPLASGRRAAMVYKLMLRQLPNGRSGDKGGERSAACNSDDVYGGGGDEGGERDVANDGYYDDNADRDIDIDGDDDEDDGDDAPWPWGRADDTPPWMRLPPRPSPQPIPAQAADGALSQLLASWPAAAPRRLALPMSHSYTRGTLGFDSLRGADARRASLLAPSPHVEVALALLQRLHEYHGLGSFHNRDFKETEEVILWIGPDGGEVRDISPSQHLHIMNASHLCLPRCTRTWRQRR